MTRTVRRFAAVLIVALALFGIFASTALATLEDTPTPTLAKTTTNPGWGADSWWRQGWGNSLYPEFELTRPAQWIENIDGYLLGTIYTVDRSAVTLIDSSTPENYYRDSFPVVANERPDGTNLDNTIDLLGIYQNPPSGFWPPADPGVNNPLEGQWYLHYSFYSNFRYQYGQWDIPFGVDLTPPTAVTGLSVSSGLASGPYDPNTWVPTKRGYVKWDAAQYDGLSGVGYYQVLIDDQPLVPETSETPTQGRAYSAPWLPTPDSFTIESLPSGRHKLSIVPVDRATNAGPATSVWYQSDPDTPTISWVAPTGNALVPAAHVISVEASDAAGDPVVNLSLGGSSIGTMTAPPYTITPDLSSLATGTYALTAKVTDRLNRTVVITKNVTWSPGGIAGSTADASFDVTGTAGTSEDSADQATGGTTGWTNNLSPVVVSDNVPDGATDIFYNVVQAKTPLDPTNLQNYFHSVWRDSTHLSGSVSLKDSIDNPPGGGWLPGPAGSVAPYEGTWYYQWVWYNKNTQAVSPTTYSVKFNVDRTPPTAVTGFTASPAAGVWTSSKRAHLTWDSHEYDALSGDAAFQIFVDDSPAISVNATSVMSGSVTIEDMPAGDHKVSIAAVDKAGNVGPKRSIQFRSDPDVPTIAWTAPTNLALTPANKTFSVDATDVAGDPTVVFKLDGGAAFTATVTAPPYSVNANLAGLSVGAHTLSATVIDHLGRVVAAPNKAVTWDTYDGSLDTTGTGGTSSASGPGVWTNSLFPVVSLEGVSGGITYNVVQTPSAINPASLSNYYHSTDGAGPLMTHVVNLKDTIDTGGPWAPGPAGSVGPYEGTWYFQWKWHAGGVGFSSTTYRLPFNVDMTPPAAVANFTSNPTPGIWTTQQRAKFSWTNSEYDTLSGTEYYQLFLDDSAWLTVNRSESVPNSITVEDMPTGNHKVSIAAVDKAGNIGPKRDIQFMSDSGVPSISFIEPTSTMTPRRHVIAVDASDAAADPLVTISISGGVFGATPVLLGTIATPPYSINPSFAGVPAGLYTLHARASDQLGRSVTASMSVMWDPADTLVTDNAVDLEDGQHIGTSSTNPGALDDIDTWWRKGWGNSLNPDFELTPPNPAVDDYGFLVGTLYDVTTSPSDINVASPDSYFRAARGTGTSLNQTIDLQGIFNYPPAGGWRPFPVVGAAKPIEGPWYLNLVWFTSKGYTSTRTYHIPMGVDLTPPSKVESLAVSPTVNSADATSVIGTSRVHISWKPKEYDALSGVAYYQVVLDGSTVIPDSPSNPAQGRVYNIPGVAPSSVTIEGLAPGAHQIGIQAVDRATNAGTVVTKTIYCDPDVPTISISKPSGTLIGPKPTVTATAADKGGVKSVVFKLDGVVISTATGAPYSGACDLTGFGSGAHTLTATVTDMFGRQATASKTVTLDKTPLVLSSFTRNYSLFYPIKRDHYKDNLTITFYANKSCSAKVLITNSAGTTVRSISKSASSGKNTVTWDGKWTADNKAHTGTFYVRVTATDSVGNSTSTGKLKTVIRNYEVIRVSSSQVKIVPR
jgi:hypothetical protein